MNGELFLMLQGLQILQVDGENLRHRENQLFLMGNSKE